MAMKDWNKMPSDDYWFRWRNKAKQIEIEVYQIRGNRRWHVSHQGTGKSFNTKGEALRYARNYMRKN